MDGEKGSQVVRRRSREGVDHHGWSEIKLARESWRVERERDTVAEKELWLTYFEYFKKFVLLITQVFVSDHPQWIKEVSPLGHVTDIPWAQHYNAMKSAAGISSTGWVGCSNPSRRGRRNDHLFPDCTIRTFEKRHHFIFDWYTCIKEFCLLKKCPLIHVDSSWWFVYSRWIHSNHSIQGDNLHVHAERHYWRPICDMPKSRDKNFVVARFTL